LKETLNLDFEFIGFPIKEKKIISNNIDGIPTYENPSYAPSVSGRSGTICDQPEGSNKDERLDLNLP
jgi:hypothetical protein